MLKKEWKDTFKLDDSFKLAIKVQSKTMDNTSLTSEKCKLRFSCVCGASFVLLFLHVLLSFSFLIFVSCLILHWFFSLVFSVEIATITKDDKGRVTLRQLSRKELDVLLEKHKDVMAGEKGEEK
jgi:hypothetical protein